MPFYAQIHNNVVVGVSQLAGDHIDQNLIPIDSLDESLLGKLWDGTTFNEPSIVQQPPNARIITKLHFISLFTDVELKNILAEAKTNLDVELLVTKINLTDSVNLEDPLTISSVNLLESSNLIPTGRAAQILAA